MNLLLLPPPIDLEDEPGKYPLFPEYNYTIDKSSEFPGDATGTTDQLLMRTEESTAAGSPENLL